MELAPVSDEPTLPRWVQIVAGLVLFPLTLLCVLGAISMFGIPKVQADPILQLLAGAISALCLWAVVLSIRLIFGIRGKYGIFGPFALRILAVGAVGLIIGGAFTGVYVDHPIRSAVLAISYVLVAVRLWRMAAQRSRGAAA
jgi:hypothetical protein